MQSTTVATGGKGSNPKTTLYVGGLEENINEAILHSAFIPFGEIKDVNIPLDNTTGKHRGFGFVDYEDKEVCSSWAGVVLGVCTKDDRSLLLREVARPLAKRHGMGCRTPPTPLRTCTTPSFTGACCAATMPSP